MRVALGLTAVVSLALALMPRVAAPAGRALTPFVWGIGTHLIGSADGAQKLDHLRELGAGSFRDDVHWQDVERTSQVFAAPATWDHFVAEASQRHLTPLLILDYGNPLYDAGERPTSERGIAAFATYAGFIASHFKSAHAIYEVWNEWHMRSREDVRAYVALLAASHDAIKRSDPGAVVIGGGFNVGAVDALETFVAEGGLRHLDGLSIHPYVHCERSRGSQGFMDLVIRMARLGQSPDALPLYITEAGWPTHRGDCGISEELAAEHLARAYLIARCLPRVAGLWWYDLKDDGPDRREREQNFGLLAVDWRPKAAAAVARRIGAWNGALTCERTIESSPEQAEYRLHDTRLGYAEMVARLLGRSPRGAR